MNPPQAKGSPARPHGAVFPLILLVTLVAYFPALGGGMLWDDAGHVTPPGLQSWSGLWRIWFEVGATQQYYPLLHSAVWVEHRIWGDATTGYHLINVIWHATSAFLLLGILRRLAIPGAMLAAFVFALHPIGVESVAWISEQKNTLSTVFYLLAMLMWLRFDTERRPRHYVFATLFFAAALLSKTVTATLPGALLVIAWWRRERLSWRSDVMPLLPWMGLGIAAGLGTAWFENHIIGAKGDEFVLTAVERGLLAGRVVWFYFGHVVWPVGLAFFYPHWTIDAGVAWQWLFPAAALIVLGFCVWWSRRNRGPLAAALFFGGTLLPVLGFVNVYPFIFSYVADHFQYLANLGMISFLAAAGTRGFAFLKWPRWSGSIIAAGILVLLGVLTWRQCGMYSNEISLYEGTLSRTPTSWVAHLNLGTALDDAGRPEESLPHLRRALELKPHYPETLNSLGNVLNHLGQPAEARTFLEEAVRIQPRFAAAYNTLGASLMAVGRAEEGVATFRRAVEIQPSLTQARINLGWALANTGHAAEALEQLEKARQQEPDNADVEIKTALTHALSGQLTEAASHARRAVELQPDNPDLHHAFGRILLLQGRKTEAAQQFEEALTLNPAHPGAREGLDLIQQQPAR
ncbi:MAG TPA: tetratricopeptide repeat protein [Opitutaceae bacterium]|nr:tetratricopeptide repeat protein [Opitutaceae bacterium]